MQELVCKSEHTFLDERAVVGVDKLGVLWGGRCDERKLSRNANTAYDAKSNEDRRHASSTRRNLGLRYCHLVFGSLLLLYHPFHALYPVTVPYLCVPCAVFNI